MVGSKFVPKIFYLFILANFWFSLQTAIYECTDKLCGLWNWWPRQTIFANEIYSSLRKKTIFVVFSYAKNYNNSRSRNKESWKQSWRA